MTPTPVVVLTIAGSDSGGGAGIQADLKTFAALGVFGTTAVTAVTAQNTAAVEHVHVLPAEVVAQQVLAVTRDLHVRAVKTGMLATAETVRRVAALAAEGALPNLVVDPVMVSSTGARLLDPDAEAAYADALFPHATVVTPNLREAGVLTGRDVTTVDDMVSAAKQLHDMGPAHVLVKGGHLGGDAIDVLYDGSDMTTLAAPRIDSANTHGSGCSLAAAIAARLAHGDDVPTATTTAKAFVHDAIAAAAGWRLGQGHGPLNHFWRTT